MALIVTFTVGMIIWVVLWSLGAKGLDALLLPLLIMVVAAAGRIFVDSQGSKK